MGGGLIILVLVFFGLTLPLLVAGLPVPLGQQLGLAGFWVLGIVLTFAPLGGRLEIGDNYIKTYFFGIATTPEIYRSDIEVITYGNMFIGGMGFGKGIKFRALIGGRSRAYSIGEIIYGKEAIAHARRVLTNVS